MKEKAYESSAVLETTVTSAGQSVDVEQLRRCEGRLVRLRLRSDSYKAQSYAMAHMWSGKDACWNEVWTIPGHAMHTPEGLVYRKKPVGVLDFQADIDALVRIISLLD